VLYSTQGRRPRPFQMVAEFRTCPPLPDVQR
jgi:hypothetical protein